MKLYLDDVRKCPENWIPVRYVRDMIQLLQEQNVSEISLDNDLGEFEPEGYEVVRWMEEKVALQPGAYTPPTIYVHTANPVARKKMLAGIESIKRMLERNKNV